MSGGPLPELQALVAGVEPGREALAPLVEALREALGAQRAVAYGVEVGPGQYLASFCHGAGFPQAAGALREALDEFLPSQQQPWGYFDPARPAPAQRNRALHFRPLAEPHARQAPLHEAGEEAWRRLGITPRQREEVQQRVGARACQLHARLGLERMYQVRALVCEGPVLLAWVGALRPEPFGAQQVALLQVLLPTLRRRLALEARLREAGLLGAALEVALEALAQPAYVITATGRAVYANSAGRARLNQSSHQLAVELRALARGEPSGERSLTPLRAPGLPAHYLVLERGEGAQAFARLESLARHWALTARETEVLSRIIQGDSNKAISARLGCAERTVEVHVTHLLSKARVESRSALIARFFQGG